MSKGIAQPNDKKKKEKGRYRKGKADDYDKSEKVTQILWIKMKIF